MNATTGPADGQPVGPVRLHARGDAPMATPGLGGAVAKNAQGRVGRIITDAILRQMDLPMNAV